MLGAVRKFRRTSDPPRLELTPLIDVVFLLLTFFIFAMLMMVRADLLGVRLPKIGAGAPAKAVEIISITIDAAGAASVNGEAVEVGALVERVLALKAEQPEARVFVAADERATAGTLLTTLDRLAGAGVEDVSLVGAPKRPVAEPPAP